VLESRPFLFLSFGIFGADFAVLNAIQFFWRVPQWLLVQVAVG